MFEMLLKSIGGIEGLLKLIGITPEQMKSHIDKIVNLSETADTRLTALEGKLDRVLNHIEKGI